MTKYYLRVNYFETEYAAYDALKAWSNVYVKDNNSNKAIVCNSNEFLLINSKNIFKCLP